MNGRRTRTILLTAMLVVAAAVPAVGAAAAAGASPTDAQHATVAADGPDPTTTAATGTGALASTQASCEFPLTETDATGTDVTVEERPERITTLNPSAAQTMWEIGGEDQVVGVTQFASYLEGADERANVSAAGFGVSVEKVVGTNPDLVLAPNASSPETVQALRDAGLTVYHFSGATTIEDVREKTTLTGRLTGNCEGAAEANAWMNANVEAAETATADAEDARALYPLGGGYIAGTETFISAMLSISGGANAAGERDLTGYPQINDEVVLELAPEYLVVTGYSSYLLDEEPYASTPAVENDNVVTVNRNWMNQPAPRSVVMGVRALTEGFHPDAAASAEFQTRAEATASMDTETPAETTDATTDTADTDTAETAATRTTSAGGTSTTTPGFGVALAVLAVLGSALLARRDR
ncbi:PGF-CTERM-anchored ABC transporter substrate-binding protein [Halobaculum sp. CBA1158]|uniref:PGF-CTERM-anchored ABC transporter substrate-binding protein n=1 Tax=Halobaculum sp. CBA1158 TaxID=2904243 RepID=UPI001F2500A8|nr:PGF-CTERM-anchored ABC transporter substrate-binding protein [Halobaculum sp. CBA1158]UIP00431.1 PGF-CTERM-anchored ABC transporter substrate-binding protein [Halobaculum sp. CBA1158]